MLVHESSHALVCLFFGLPYSWSWRQVVYERNRDALVNVFVGLTGGIGQAMFSLIFFWYLTTLEKVVLAQSLYGTLFEERRSPKLSILLGFELAFLTIAFHGVVNGIWEGLFYQSYEQVYDNFALWGIIILVCGAVSLYIIRRRYLQLTLPK